MISRGKNWINCMHIFDRYIINQNSPKIIVTENELNFG